MYFDRLYSFVFHSVNRDHATAEDIVQNIFVSALRSAKLFKGNSKIYTWLASIAHKKITDYYRRERKEGPHNIGLINDAPTNFQSIAHNSHPTSDIPEPDEMGDAIAKALSSLPLDYKQVLLFKYVEEMTVLEISQVMRRSPKSIEGLLTRARRLLKESLSGKS